MAKVARLQSLLPRSRIFREEDPWALVRFTKGGPRKQPRNEAEWAHHFLKKSSRLVLTLDMSSEATYFRNQLKAKYLHPWGRFPDTRFELIDPLPDRYFYIKMYKDTINDFCAKGRPEFPVGPTLNFSVSEQSRISGLVKQVYSGLVKHVYPEIFIQGMRVIPKKPSEGHFLIMTSFPKGSVVHLLRDYFIKELGKFPNDEVQRVMKNVGKEKFKAQMPLGYCTHMGKLRAEETKDEIAREFVGSGGLHLGTAVSLSLWRKHYDEDPEDKWGDPVLVDRECLYSKALGGISKMPSSSFVSIAPEKQFTKETLESGDGT